MFILLSFIIILVVYVCSFKNDFTEEHLSKVTPVLIIGCVVIGLIFLMGLFRGK